MTEKKPYTKPTVTVLATVESPQELAKAILTSGQLEESASRILARDRAVELIRSMRPVTLPEVDMQMLIDAGFNAFGLQLFAESVANVRDRAPGDPDFKPFTFLFRNIKITLEPNGPVDTRHA